MRHFEAEWPTYLKPARVAAFWKAEDSVVETGEKRGEWVNTKQEGNIVWRLPQRQRWFHVLVGDRQGLHCTDCSWKNIFLVYFSSSGEEEQAVECSFKHLKPMLQKCHLGPKSALLFWTEVDRVRLITGVALLKLHKGFGSLEEALKT